MMSRGTIAGLVLLLPLAACGGSGDEPESAAAPSVATTASPSASASSEPRVIAPRPGRVKLTNSSCWADWPVVINPQEQAVVGTATVRNDGDEPKAATVTMRWFPVGYAPIKASKRVRVHPGRVERVPFMVPVDMGVMGGMVGLQHGDEMCAVSAS